MQHQRAGGAAREFERFVTQSTDGLYRTAYLMTWDGAESEDLVQETFFKVSRRWARVRSMPHPYAFARRVLINLIFDSATPRSRSRQQLSLVGQDDAPVDHRARIALEQVDDSELIGRALATLAPRQRMVLVLRYWDDLSEADVATVMGCTVGTVKSTAARGAARLADELTRQNAASLTVSSPTIGGSNP